MKIFKLPFKEYVEPPRGERFLRLCSNENLFVPKNLINKLLSEASKLIDGRIYPEAYGGFLKGELARYLGVSEEMLYIGNGSDEVIRVLCAVFLRGPAKRVVTLEPTFSMYEHAAKLFNGLVVKVHLNPEDYSLKLEPLLKEVKREDTALAFICNPNNPTGNQFPKDEVLEIVENAKCPVVVDEAYADFAEYNLLKQVEEYENLIILRTFSKAWGLAGFRVGYTVARPEVPPALRAVSEPFNVSSISQAVCVAALRRNYVKRVVEEVKKERAFLGEQLKSRGFRVFPSNTNFLFFRYSLAKRIYRELLRRGVVLRDFSSQPLCENCLRVTVPPRESCLYFLEKLDEAVNVVEGGGC